MNQYSTEEIIERLEILFKKEKLDGWHVRANTVSLAIDEIKRLQLELLEKKGNEN